MQQRPAVAPESCRRGLTRFVAATAGRSAPLRQERGSTPSRSCPTWRDPRTYATGHVGASGQGPRLVRQESIRLVSREGQCQVTLVFAHRLTVMTRVESRTTERRGTQPTTHVVQR